MREETKKYDEKIMHGRDMTVAWSPPVTGEVANTQCILKVNTNKIS